MAWIEKTTLACRFALRRDDNVLHDDRGAIAIIFALVAFLLIASVGAAVDVGAAYSKRAHLQSAIDAAALGVASLITEDPGKNITAGTHLFQANYPDHASVDLDIDVVHDAVVIKAGATSESMFLQTIGFGKFDINVAAKVPLLKDGKAEVVLVLDYSDSMIDNSKYVRLKEAAFKLIDDITDNGKNTNVKIGIVPFAALVHADLPAAYVRSDVAYSGCTQDRRHPHNMGEEAGHAGDDSKWGEVTSTHPCAEMAAAGLKVVPLSSDIDAVKTALGAMQPYVWTHIAAGVEMGWQVLSPTGPFSTGAAYGEKGLVKAMILLTDGMQTAPGWGPGATASTGDAEANLKQMCTRMKARKIDVYTIGYDLHDTHTLDLLSSCSGPGRFYDAKDVNSGLVTTFQSITISVREAMLRLAN